MKRTIGYITVVLLVAFAAMSVAAQDYRKFEVFGGYAYANYDNVLDSIDNGIDSNISLRGVNASATYNFHPYVGVKFDYSLTANRKDYNDPTVDLEVKYKNNQFLGGIQIKDNRDEASRFKPFAHILAGLANQKYNVTGTVITTPPTVNLLDAHPSTNNFAMVLGGGLDIKVHKNIDIRVVQFDYNPVFFGDQQVGPYRLDGQKQNNIRMSFGVVFH